MDNQSPDFNTTVQAEVERQLREAGVRSVDKSVNGAGGNFSSRNDVLDAYISGKLTNEQYDEALAQL